MNRPIVGALVGFAAAVLLLVVSVLDRGLFGVEWLAYDAMVRMIAGKSRPDPRIVIVSINEKSIRTLEPFYGRPPYSRRLMALVTDEIRRGGGQVAVFDILFSEENPADPEGDREFAAALGSLPSVLAVNTEPKAELTPPHPYRDKLWRVEGSDAPLSKLTPPIPMFAAAAAIGTIRMSIQARAATNREYPLVDRVEQDLYVPSLALAAAATRLDLPRSGRFSGGVFQAGNRAVPVKSNGAFFIRWSGAKKKEKPLDLSYPSVDFDKVVVAALSRTDPEAGYTVEQADAFARGTFGGKIALVALTTAGAASDLRATPLSPASAGVEIHANALDNLLNGRFNREAGRIPIAALLLIATTICGLLIHPIRSPLLASLIALGFIAAWMVAGYLAMDRGWIIHPVTPSMAILVTFIASTAINVITEQRQTLRLRATFGHYVSPQILDYLLSDPTRVRLGGERRELTILFSDIRGFTSISEAAEPEDVVEMLNEYLSRMVDILLRHGGTLDKFIGDAVMGFWNAPTRDPDHARHAVQCAIEMVGETARLREKWSAEGKAPIRIGIGINTGEAVVGNIGSKQVFGYTVIGDAVNLASRLEGTNKEYGTEIIISETTRDRIGDGVETVCLGEVKVKGKERAVRIFEVKGKYR